MAWQRKSCGCCYGLHLNGRKVADINHEVDEAGEDYYKCYVNQVIKTKRKIYNLADALRFAEKKTLSVLAAELTELKNLMKGK